MTVASRLPEIVTIANCQLLWQTSNKKKRAWVVPRRLLCPFLQNELGDMGEYG